MTRLEPLLKSDKTTLSFEAIGDDKVRVNCASWEDAKVILADETLQVVAFGKNTHGDPHWPTPATARRRSNRLCHRCDPPSHRCDREKAMSIETEKKRLTDYLNEQVAEREANKVRARAHCASTIDE